MSMEPDSPGAPSAQPPRPRGNGRLVAVCAAAVVLVAAMAVTVYFAVRGDSPPAVSDLVVEDIVVGEGEASQAGDRLSVYYTLWLEDGTQIQSNVGGDPFKFTLGAGEVIKGWDQGLVGMKVGGIRKLTIPPDLAYGDRASQDLPANSTLVFEVQLLAIE
jgi:FKBP-type peptidyl-prolyl cis-trans isomerase FkpA